MLKLNSAVLNKRRDVRLISKPFNWKFQLLTMRKMTFTCSVFIFELRLFKKCQLHESVLLMKT